MFENNFENYIIFISIFGLIVIVLAMVITPPIRTKFHTESTNQKSQTKSPTQPPNPRFLSFWSYFWRTTSVLAVLLGASSSIVTIWGPFWRTAPIVHPPISSGPNSLEFPFIIDNKSVVFSVKADIACIIDLMYLKDGKGNVLIFSDLLYKTTITIPQAKEIYYTCDGYKFFHALPNGGFRIGTNQKFLDSPPGELVAPFSLVKTCIWIQISGYPAFRFRWPLTANAQQWIDDSLVEGIPDTDIAPAVRPARAYGLRRLVDSYDVLLPRALQCWQPVGAHIDFSSASSSAPATYLVEPTLAACQARSHAQCRAMSTRPDGSLTNCRTPAEDGTAQADTTQYWWSCEPLTDGRYVLRIESNGPYSGTATNAIVTARTVLTPEEIAALQTAAQLGPLLPEVNR